MFDEINPETPSSQTEPDDIFGGVDNAAGNQIKRPDSSSSIVAPSSIVASPATTKIPSQSSVGGVKKKILLAAAAVLVIIMVVVIGWLVYSSYFSSFADRTNQPADLDSGVPAVNDNGADNLDSSGLPANRSDAAVTEDSDFDGLSDQEETQLGTSSVSADSDLDGLFDKEEVYIYKTNPLGEDSDNDGYSDGDEVRNGYNPAGPGRLFNPGE